MHSYIKKFDPVVDKRVLLLLSGMMWSIVGIMLCRLAVSWLSHADLQKSILLALAGTVMALLIHHFGFLKLVDRNIERIASKQGTVCIFAFQPWKSYLIIAIMVGLGIALRSSPLPKHYLSVIYIGFGGAMVLSSIRYFRIFFKLIFKH